MRSSRAALAAATVEPIISLVRTLNYSTTGDGGGATWVEVTNTGALQPWQVQSNGGARRWSIDKNQNVNALMFGARGDASISLTTLVITGTDDTAAIQNTIDFALQSSIPDIYLSPGGNRKFKTTDTLHLGWGNSFYTIRLHGTEVGGAYGGTGAGSAIFCTATDRPTINIQGARRSGVFGIAFVGQNYRHVWDQRIFGDNLSAVAADWLAPALTPAGNAPGGLQRHAPYAAITIDAAFANFDKLSESTAKRVVRFWQMAPGNLRAAG